MRAIVRCHSMTPAAVSAIISATLADMSEILHRAAAFPKVANEVSE